MTARTILAQVCGEIPGLQRAAIVLVPDGVVAAHVGGTRESDVEPLVRAALACAPCNSERGTVVEVSLVSAESVLVIETARATGRFLLAVECVHEANLALVTASTRLAAAAFEAAFDSSPWDAA